MLFYLGTHQVAWLRRYDVPLFVSARRLRSYKRVPRARGRWALDSGGFSELSMFGRWKTSAEVYAAEVDRWAVEVGGLDWAAPQDWMCEPAIREKTGLTVEEHQRRTVASVVQLRQLVKTTPIIPVLQGWALPDYLRCVDLYAAAGIDLTKEPTVGLGTVCRRQSTTEAAEIVRTIAALGIKLHGFGFKRGGLAKVGHLMTSSDSLAWSDSARRKPVRLPGCAHGKNGNGTCANCPRWAMQWRAATVLAISRTGGQMDENTNENTNETADLVSAETTTENTTPDPIALPFGIESGSERYWSARVDDRRLIFRRGLLQDNPMTSRADQTSFAVVQKKLGAGFTLTDRTIVGKLDNGAHLTIAQVHADNKTRWQFTLVTLSD